MYNLRIRMVTIATTAKSAAIGNEIAISRLIVGCFVCPVVHERSDEEVNKMTKELQLSYGLPFVEFAEAQTWNLSNIFHP